MLSKAEFKRVGHLIIDIGNGIDTFGNQSTDVYLCPTCSALVADPEAHRKWHTVAKVGLA